MDIIETWALLAHGMLSWIIHFVSFSLKFAKGGGGVQSEGGVSELGNSDHRQFICSFFKTIKHNVSCWKLVTREKIIPQSEVD